MERPIAFNPHGNIALISTTGAGGGFGGDIGIVGQVGYQRATSVLDLEPVGIEANTTVTLGDGLQGSVGVDTAGNVTLGIGVGEGVVSSGTIDKSRVRIIACPGKMLSRYCGIGIGASGQACFYFRASVGTEGSWLIYP
jgi:hypothetical protein